MKNISRIAFVCLPLALSACGAVPEDSDPTGAEHGSGDESATAASGAGLTLSRRLGFAWASDPSASHVANPLYSFNSAVGSINIEKTGTGQYLVRFDHLGAGGGLSLIGSPQVVAYGNNPNRCTMSGLGTSGDDLLIGVQCRNPAGAAVDSMFVASYDETPRLASADVAHAACVQGGTSHTPPPATTFNPSGGGASLIRQGTGLYTMSFPGLNSFRGVPVVTPMGDQDRMCQVINYTLDGSDLNIRIACYTNTGVLADAIFAVKYEGRLASQALPFDLGFAWANDPVAALYTPNTNYNWNPFHDSATVNRAGTGANGPFLRFPSFPPPASNDHSTAMVTAYGPSATPAHCKPVSWFADTLYVRCFRPSGTPLASRHLAQLVNLTD
jgi:hypothetical protein